MVLLDRYICWIMQIIRRKVIRIGFYRSKRFKDSIPSRD